MKIAISMVIAATLLVGCKQSVVPQQPVLPAPAVEQPVLPEPIQQLPERPDLSQSTPSVPADDWQTYVDERFGFTLQYPKGWVTGEGRLSPQAITDHAIGSDNAPIHIGAVSPDKDVFLNTPGVTDFGYYDYQIQNDERTSPDSQMEINGLVFQRYDLIDYGRYEGTSAGNVILLVSPPIGEQKISFVFEWLQFPGGDRSVASEPQDFLSIASTFKLQ